MDRSDSNQALAGAEKSATAWRALGGMERAPANPIESAENSRLPTLVRKKIITRLPAEEPMSFSRSDTTRPLMQSGSVRTRNRYVHAAPTPAWDPHNWC